MKNKKIRAYFAHPHICRTHGAANLILKVLKEHLPEVEFVNPFEQGDITERWLTHPTDLSIAKEIVRKDLALIQDCNIVIAYFPNTAGTEKLTGGIGTPMELFYTRHILNKPAYALTCYKHPWLIGLDVRCEDNIDVLIARIRREMGLP